MLAFAPEERPPLSLGTEVGVVVGARYVAVIATCISDFEEGRAVVDEEDDVGVPVV